MRAYGRGIFKNERPQEIDHAQQSYCHPDDAACRMCRPAARGAIPARDPSQNTRGDRDDDRRVRAGQHIVEHHAEATLDGAVGP